MDGGGQENDKLSDDRRSLVRIAYDQIRDHIVHLRFPPGQFLNESDICNTLGLGRTPVHQALQLLQMEGLVEIRPRKGIVFLPDDLTQMLNVIEARRTLEPKLAEFAAANAVKNAVGKAHATELVVLAGAREVLADPPDFDLFVSNDRKFHAKIGKLSGNPVMADFARILHDRTCRFWHLNLWSEVKFEASREDHLLISRAIRRGEGQVAAREMLAHISKLSDSLRKLPPSVLNRMGCPPGC